MLTKASNDLIVKDLDISKREAVLAHATYKTLDRDGDRMNRGMFDKSWKENMHLLRYFLNHRKTEAPGKAARAWDDDEHAYTLVKHGTHTIGEDVLKMLDEGVITAVSFGFDPIKYKEIKGKGKDYKEAMHLETSVLTHWGAHDDSTVLSVTKALNGFPSLVLKKLSNQEQNLLKKLIANGMDSIQAAVALADNLDVESDLYTMIHWFIARQSEQIGNLKSELRYGMKEIEALTTQVKNMESFIRNTSASDEAIQLISKELINLKNILKGNSNTAVTTDGSFKKCPKCATYSVITNETGDIHCAECNHVLKSGQPDASGDKDELRRKLLLLKTKLSLTA
jgi:HK97 family phage prohead protease